MNKEEATFKSNAYNEIHLGILGVCFHMCKDTQLTIDRSYCRALI